MLSTVPLFPGIPGGIEVLIVLMILLLFGGVLVFVVGLLGRSTSNDAEVERLERRVEELERQQREAGGRHDDTEGGWDDGRN